MTVLKKSGIHRGQRQADNGQEVQVISRTSLKDLQRISIGHEEVHICKLYLADLSWKLDKSQTTGWAETLGQIGRFLA